jgi:hypothetical protein
VPYITGGKRKIKNLTKNGCFEYSYCIAWKLPEKERCSQKWKIAKFDCRQNMLKILRRSDKKGKESKVTPVTGRGGSIGL